MHRYQYDAWSRGMYFILDIRMKRRHDDQGLAECYGKSRVGGRCIISIVLYRRGGKDKKKRKKERKKETRRGKGRYQEKLII